MYLYMQEIIKKYTKISASGNKYATLASATGSLTWGRPLYIDYQQLSRYFLLTTSSNGLFSMSVAWQVSLYSIMHKLLEYRLTFLFWV